MPDNMQQVQNDFFDIAAFPRVGAAIDCTHVKIQSPGGNDAELFRNRKNYFSINVQAACDSHLKILDIVARWPGGTHDSTIFNNTRLKARFEAGHFLNTVLIGDSGYPLRPYFFTPINNPNTQEKRLYNESHIRTRNCVERMFGVWKRRFPVLAYGLRLKLQTTLTLIVACAVLHNIAIEMNEPIEVPPAHAINVHELENLINLGHIPQIPHANDNNRGDIRQEFINNYFRNL
ncbi:hypothetical protein RI129_002743 [Pyrocoelia pectoralis]|uniref:DDE Tnp4 domain-containing protein n=1 Tax=Pyrocoelia pectoralis TaxID=417401 RepID=A0AAN7VMI2_9COLE